jgi:Zn finger protein HypA/HybF involved in hydrogenase expression
MMLNRFIFAIMNFITIKTARNTADFLVLKSKLESEGIRCRINNDLSSQVLNYLPMMVEAELQIAEEDVALYRELIAADEVINPVERKIVCPYCGSETIRVKYTPKSLLVALGVIIASVASMTAPTNIFKHAKLKCMHCYHVFSQDDSE